MTTYSQAGVDLEGAERHVARIAAAVTATWGEDVVGGFGGFAAGIELPAGYRRPVLMMSTDGVGTKLELARVCERWDGVGFDLVAMCVDDLAAAGARPLGFVDYLAVGRLHAERDAAIVTSVASACRSAGCALLGGETAEHPGVMPSDQVDLAGAALGVLERGEELGPHRVRPGQVIVGIPSPNLRSNGFSLVRRVFAASDLEEPFPDADVSTAERLLEPSLVYAPAVLDAVASGGVAAGVHVTGGGLPGNLQRALPEGCRAVLDRSSWEVPAVFGVVQERGAVPDEEMARTFNLGIGFCLVAEPEAGSRLVEILAGHGHAARLIGEIIAGERGVVLR